MAGPTIALRNISRQPFTATLIHGLYCDCGGKCGCRIERYTSTDRGDDGALRNRSGTRTAPSSFTVWAGEELGGFHPCIVRLPGVDGALARGILIARDEVEAEEAVAPQVKESPPETRTRPRRIEAAG